VPSILERNTSKPENPVAIVGYSYRMPGGFLTDDDFWRLLSERETVQESITARYGQRVHMPR